MTPEQNKQFIQRFVEQVLNRKNIDLIDEIAAEDFLEHVPFPGQGPGRQGLKDVVSAFHAAFADMHWKIEEQIAEGDKVVTRFTMTATHRGNFLGIAPTGRKVNVWGVVIDVIKNGKMAQSRIIMDIPTLMAQLGAG